MSAPAESLILTPENALLELVRPMITRKSSVLYWRSPDHELLQSLCHLTDGYLISVCMVEEKTQKPSTAPKINMYWSKDDRGDTLQGFPKGGRYWEVASLENLLVENDVLNLVILGPADTRRPEHVKDLLADVCEYAKGTVVIPWWVQDVGQAGWLEFNPGTTALPTQRWRYMTESAQRALDDEIKTAAGEMDCRVVQNLRPLISLDDFEDVTHAVPAMFERNGMLARLQHIGRLLRAAGADKAAESHKEMKRGVETVVALLQRPAGQTVWEFAQRHELPKWAMQRLTIDLYNVARLVAANLDGRDQMDGQSFEHDPAIQTWYGHTVLWYQAPEPSGDEDDDDYEDGDDGGEDDDIDHDEDGDDDEGED